MASFVLRGRTQTQEAVTLHRMLQRSDEVRVTHLASMRRFMTQYPMSPKNPVSDPTTIKVTEYRSKKLGTMISAVAPWHVASAGQARPSAGHALASKHHALKWQEP